MNFQACGCEFDPQVTLWFSFYLPALLLLDLISEINKSYKKLLHFASHLTYNNVIHSSFNVFKNPFFTHNKTHFLLQRNSALSILEAYMPHINVQIPAHKHQNNPYFLKEMYVYLLPILRHFTVFYIKIWFQLTSFGVKVNDMHVQNGKLMT